MLFVVLVLMVFLEMEKNAMVCVNVLIQKDLHSLHETSYK